MASFDNTVELERTLLHKVMQDNFSCRLHMHKLKELYFTSTVRLFIFELARQTFHDTKSLLTRNIFEYEVNAKIDDKERTFYVGEWNLIEAADSPETVEALVQKLEEAHVGRELSRIGDEVDTYLEKGRIAEALAHIKQNMVTIGFSAEDKPLSELTDIQRRKDILLDKKAHPEKYRGLKTGFSLIDRSIGGLFPGELTLLAGITGTGKSTLVRQLQKNVVVLNPGVNVLHIANEEYQEQVEHKFDALFTEIPYMDFKTADITDDDMAQWEEFMKDWKSGKFQYGKVFIKEVPAFTDVMLAEQAYRQLESQGIKIGLITIDHLPHIKPIQPAWGENDERFKAAADCKELARWLRLPVVVPTQGATVLEEKQQKGKRGGKLDVYGSKGQVHVANNFIIITDKGKVDDQPNLEEWEKDVLWLVDAKKTRDGPPFWFLARHSVKYGKVEEIKNTGNQGSPSTEVEAVKSIKRESRPAGGDEEVVQEIDKVVAEEGDKEGAISDSASTEVQTAETDKPSIIRGYLARQKKATIQDSPDD